MEGQAIDCTGSRPIGSLILQETLIGNADRHNLIADRHSVFSKSEISAASRTEVTKSYLTLTVFDLGHLSPITQTMAITPD